MWPREGRGVPRSYIRECGFKLKCNPLYPTKPSLVAVSFPSHRQWLLPYQQLRSFRDGVISLSLFLQMILIQNSKKKCLLKKKNKGTKEPYPQQPCRVRPAAGNYGQISPSHIDREKRQLRGSLGTTRLPSPGIMTLPQIDKEPCSLEE